MEEIKTMKEKDMNDVTSKQRVARVVGKILIYLFLAVMAAVGVAAVALYVALK